MPGIRDEGDLPDEPPELQTGTAQTESDDTSQKKIKQFLQERQTRIK